MKHFFKSLVFVVFLTGCGGVVDKVETAANRSYTSYALGKPYTKIASIGTSPLAQLAADQTGFGPMIGATPLANGSTIYRHMAPAAETETSADAFGLVGSNTSRFNYRLSYFLVDGNGIVTDWATGSVPGNASSCMTFVGGIFRKCEDLVQVRTSLEIYDAQVKTRDNQPISVWGFPAAPAS